MDTDFIGDGFLRDDVRVDWERHLIFASDDQLSRLQQSNRWFVDGTFHVVWKPFYQLLFVHALLRRSNIVVFPVYGNNLCAVNYVVCN